MLVNRDWIWTQETLREVVRHIKLRKDETEAEAKASGTFNEFIQGECAGYEYAIDMIRNDLEGRGYDFDKFVSGEQE